MKIIHTIDELKSEIDAFRSDKKNIGFVPTMGALHDGHISLVQRCVLENDICVVSIFVNPTQFNNSDDLVKYPRDLKHDSEMLERAGCNLVFNPEAHEIYSNAELSDTFNFDFDGLDYVMEGKFRPGHFNGVVQIVSKLFNLIQPQKAYFGEKDFQQLAIIHLMVRKLNLNTEIIDCQIIREQSGLAMSSRNERLTPEQRKNAAQISKVLFESRNFVPQFSPEELKNRVITQINQIPDLKVEYFEIVDSETLHPIVNNWKRGVIGCIAVFCGTVRLIDNVRFNP
jgi:pantoate--beta-alanine ligase